MIVESRAVAPFFKNGFVVACEETRRRPCLIDPGDEVDELLAVVRDARPVRHPHPRHARTHGSRGRRHRGEAGHGRARRAAPRRPVPLRKRRAAGPDVRLRGRCSRRRPTSSSSRARDSAAATSNCRVPHAGAQPRRCVFRLIAPAGSQARRGVRRRHAVRGLDRPDRSAAGRLQDADGLDPRRADDAARRPASCIRATVRARPSGPNARTNPFLRRQGWRSAYGTMARAGRILACARPIRPDVASHRLPPAARPARARIRPGRRAAPGLRPAAPS